jgi:hypothetical protein
MLEPVSIGAHMPLLHSTDIDNLVKKNIRGFIARAGGSVDQLVDYRQCVVEDINIPDGGFGKICKADSFVAAKNAIPFLKRFLRQEILFLFQGQKISRDRKTVVLDMHHAHERNELHNKYNCAISSNLLEHSPNPIWLLLNFYFITRKDGYQFHAIPHYKYTYDRFRLPTPLEHFVKDFENHADVSDMSHVEDYRQSAVEKDGWQRLFHRKYPMQYPFIHFHVFDEYNIKALCEFMFEDVVTDVYKTELFSDNVVIFKNCLNNEFVKLCGKCLTNYSCYM